jgi:hypothetical protein
VALDLKRIEAILGTRRPLGIKGFSNTSGLRRTTSDFGGGPPVFMLGRALRQTTTLGFGVVCALSNGADTGARYGLGLENTAHKLRAFSVNDAGTQGASGTATFVTPIGEWFVGLAAIRATNARFCWGGGIGTTGTADIPTPITITHEAVGGLQAASNFFNPWLDGGIVGPVTFLSAEPAVGALERLWHGEPEWEVLDPATILRAWWPFEGVPMGYDFSMAGAHLGVVGTGLSFAPGPPIRPPRRRRVFKLPGGATFNQTIGASVATSASLSAIRAFLAVLGAAAVGQVQRALAAVLTRSSQGQGAGATAKTIGHAIGAAVGRVAGLLAQLVGSTGSGPARLALGDGAATRSVASDGAATRRATQDEAVISATIRDDAAA